jgi:hypothetical protein
MHELYTYRLFYFIVGYGLTHRIYTFMLELFPAGLLISTTLLVYWEISLYRHTRLAELSKLIVAFGCGYYVFLSFGTLSSYVSEVVTVYCVRLYGCRGGSTIDPLADTSWDL